MSCCFVYLTLFTYLRLLPGADTCRISKNYVPLVSVELLLSFPLTYSWSECPMYYSGIIQYKYIPMRDQKNNFTKTLNDRNNFVWNRMETIPLLLGLVLHKVIITAIHRITVHIAYPTHQKKFHLLFSLTMQQDNWCVLI